MLLVCDANEIVLPSEKELTSYNIKMTVDTEKGKVKFITGNLTKAEKGNVVAFLNRKIEEKGEDVDGGNRKEKAI